MPKISIITICYNEDRVEDTCKSVIAQTFKDYEWIFIDGGSNEKYLEIHDKYKSYMSVFISEKDSGIYNAMNKGLSFATGEFVVFMNAGDCFYDETENILKDVGFKYTYMLLDNEFKRVEL